MKLNEIHNINDKPKYDRMGGDVKRDQNISKIINALRHEDPLHIEDVLVFLKQVGINDTMQTDEMEDVLHGLSTAKLAQLVRNIEMVERMGQV